MDKPTKPTNLMPRSFGGVKNNFSASLQSSGYEDGVPAIYGGDNLNYQLDATGKELDYCEKFADFLNAIPIGKTITVDTNNKLVYADLVTDTSGKANIGLDNLSSDGKARIAIKQYLVTEIYALNDVVMAIVDDEVALYKSLVSNNVGNAISDDTKWEKVEMGGSSRNVGEIVASTLPLTDAGLHLLDGTRLSGDGIYGEFVDYIADLYAENPSANYFTDETSWQASVTQYGVCGKFVYNSTNNTVRLPKITGFLEGTTDATALGSLIEAGLPNITGNITNNFTGTYPGSSGCMNITVESDSRAFSTGTSWTVKPTIVDIDASRSSSIYGNSTTVQPQTIKAFVYIVIANSTKTSIQVDIDEIATDLNGKADTDLTNVTDTGYIKMAGAGMPSDTYIDLTLGASGTSYTAPADGWVYFSKVCNGSNQEAFIEISDTNYNFTIGGFMGRNGDGYKLIMPIKKNTVFKVLYGLGGATEFFRFVYAVGSESEAS